MERVTDEQAAEIYARFLASRYRGKAKKIAKEKLAELNASGDREGVAIWKKVEGNLQS
jgi:hypothetical protein